MTGRVSSSNPNVRQPNRRDMFLINSYDRNQMRRNYRHMRESGVSSYGARSIIFTSLLAGQYGLEIR